MLSRRKRKSITEAGNNHLNQPNDNVPSIKSATKKVVEVDFSNDVMDGSTPLISDQQQALDWCRQARQLWLSDKATASDLVRVEELYRAALNAKRKSRSGNTKPMSATTTTTTKRRKPTNNNDATTYAYAALSPSDYRNAGERLSLLYLQSGKPQIAKSGLQYLGFTCRLSECILNYPNPSNQRSVFKSSVTKKKNHQITPPCCIMDEFLTHFQFQYLQSVFGDPHADYWTDHNYSVEPPSPYFSYVLSITSLKRNKSYHFTFLEGLVQQLYHCPILRQRFPQLKNARFVELWAHNRPHASGHQMHFDSENEGKGDGGKGVIRNPIISTIMYLSDNTTKDDSNDDYHVGGPSLITTQTLQSTSLSDVKGWLAYSKPRRMVAFDGMVLHGVIPGKGVLPLNVKEKERNDSKPRSGGCCHRRVTLMLAFWKEIKIRNSSSQPGAARPWPKTNNEDMNGVPSWVRQLNAVCLMEGTKDSIRQSPSVVDPLPIGHVYEDLDGRPWNDDPDGMPEYEQVFQGF